jgi:nucleoside-diphosphate-sugar epimerase
MKEKSNYGSKKFLITGHKGFIGKSLCKRFEAPLGIEKSFMGGKSS